MDKKSDDNQGIAGLLKSIIDVIAEGILVTEHGGKVLFYNQTLLDILNLPETIFSKGTIEAMIEFMASQMENPDQYFEELILGEDEVELSPPIEINFKNGRTIKRFGSSFLLKRGGRSEFGYIVTLPL